MSLYQTTMTLTPHEIDTFAAAEATIERGLQTFYDVGEALLSIRDQRLYRAEYPTFEMYCRTRWGMSKTQANRLVDAAEVMESLTPIGVIPANEAQARPLAAVPPAERAEVWQEAVAAAPNGKVTAAHVQAVVEARRTPEPPAPAALDDGDDGEPLTPYEASVLQAERAQRLALQAERIAVARAEAEATLRRKRGEPEPEPEPEPDVEVEVEVPFAPLPVATVTSIVYASDVPDEGHTVEDDDGRAIIWLDTAGIDALGVQALLATTNALRLLLQGNAHEVDTVALDGLVELLEQRDGPATGTLLSVLSEISGDADALCSTQYRRAG